MRIRSSWKKQTKVECHLHRGDDLFAHDRELEMTVLKWVVYKMKRTRGKKLWTAMNQAWRISWLIQWSGVYNKQSACMEPVVTHAWQNIKNFYHTKTISWDTSLKLNSYSVRKAQLESNHWKQFCWRDSKWYGEKSRASSLTMIYSFYCNDWFDRNIGLSYTSKLFPVSQILGGI